MEFILFGAGDIGIRAYKVLGKNHVSYFADNKKYGTEIYGKKVLSFEEMVQRAEKYQILITSDKYVDVLEEQLQNAGVNNYLIFNRRYNNEMKKVLPQYNYLYNTKYMDYTDILLNYKIHKYRRIGIYGINEYIGSLLLELAIQSVLDNVVAIIDPDIQEGFVHGIPVMGLNDVRSCIDCLLVNKKRVESGIREEAENEDFVMIDMYDIDKFVFYNRHPELEQFRSIHKGERAFILGNGPSLAVSDLETLKKNHEICFGLNKIHKIYGLTEWRPDYICMSDARVINACENELDEITAESVVFMADRFFYSDKVRFRSDNVQYVHLKSESFYPNLPGFSGDITESVYWGGSVAYDLTLQIAAYMGFEEIYLLGMDHYNVGSVVDPRNHFSSDYFSDEEKAIYEGVAADFDSMNLAYQKAETYSRKHGFRIYNATRGGRLEAFERVDFDGLFQKNMGGV